jgi:hypothetical protein
VNETPCPVRTSGGSLRERVEALMLAPPADPTAHGDALTSHQVSELLGVERSEVTAAWRGLVSEYTELAERLGWRGNLAGALEGLEGLATLREVATASARTAESADRAYGLTRAVVESGVGVDLAWRRSGVTVLVSSRRLDRETAVDPHELIDHASELRHVVSSLIASGDVVSVSRLEQAVQLSPELRALTVLSGARLSVLAAAQIPHVLSNRRGELYLADLKPVYALAAVAETLPPREVTADELRRRVRGRFPGALPLPDGTALDEAVKMGTGRTRGVHGYRLP